MFAIVAVQVAQAVGRLAGSGLTLPLCVTLDQLFIALSGSQFPHLNSEGGVGSNSF